MLRIFRGGKHIFVKFAEYAKKMQKKMQKNAGQYLITYAEYAKNKMKNM